MTKVIALLGACAATVLVIVYAALPVDVPAWLLWLALAFGAAITLAWGWQTRFGTRRSSPDEIRPPTWIRWR
ncbi:hypothetical protein [Rhizomicrobium electricum]|uniref:DUF4175 domain-containing protein n=1 Tax=Rhizomicrobium electricum TaxID=480070 RepID=A0ABN1DZ12_9PROT|nr:hypothetical protein [Rhizomicrobium electricum]NIJ47246.1 hypothetical protein [Rhizomicrobium electricum]